MPIVDVEVVAAKVDPKLAQPLADAIGHAFKAEPGKVWVRLRALPPAFYAENHAKEPPQPVFVTILSRSPPRGPTLDRRIGQITEAVARLTGRPPQNVHVLFEQGSAGRIAFGGQLVSE